MDSYYRTGFAENPYEARYPNLWKNLACALVPGLGQRAWTSDGFKDLSGHNGDGVINAGDLSDIAYHEDEFWGCPSLEFTNASSQYVSVPDEHAVQRIQGSERWSIFLRLYRKNTTYSFCAGRTLQYNEGHHFGVENGADVACSTSAGSVINQTFIQSTTGWINVVVTGNTWGSTIDEQILCFVNGSPRTISFSSGGLSDPLSSAAGLEYLVGFHPVLSAYADGFFSMFLFYDRQLTHNEILLLDAVPFAPFIKIEEDFGGVAGAAPAIRRIFTVT